MVGKFTFAHKMVHAIIITDFVCPTRDFYENLAGTTIVHVAIVAPPFHQTKTPRLKPSHDQNNLAS
jgi:hypothetical protein